MQPFSHGQTSLKRNKSAFNSTIQQTKVKSQSAAKYRSKYNDNTANSLRTHKREDNQNQAMQNKGNPPHEESISINHLCELISNYVYEEQKQYNTQDKSMFARHLYYKGISRTFEGPVVPTPSFIKKQYKDKLIKNSAHALTQPISMCYGYLKKMGCLFYAIENIVFFVWPRSISKYMGFPQMAGHSQKDEQFFYIKQQVKSQVINIVQISGENSLFPEKSFVLGVIHPWEIEFYCWYEGPSGKDKYGKIQQLNFRLPLPTEKVNNLGVTDSGQIYFFDERANLFHICQEETKFFFLKTGRHAIKRHIYKHYNSVQLERNCANKLSKMFSYVKLVGEVVKLALPSSIEAEEIICDNKRKLLFGKMKKRTNVIFGVQKESFIVCYDIREKTKKFVNKISEKFFVHLFPPNFSNRAHDNIFIDAFQSEDEKFSIHSIAEAPPNCQRANLVVVSSTGIKIMIQMNSNDVKIVQIIHPPGLRVFKQTTSFLDNTRYNPSQVSGKLLTFVEIGNISIFSILLNDKSDIYSYLVNQTQSLESSDINLSISKIDTQQIYEKLLWSEDMKVKVLCINSPYRKQQISSKYVRYPSSELVYQSKLDSVSFIYMNEEKVQVIQYMRPIDILFTALRLKKLDRYSNSNIWFSSKQKLLSRIFLEKGTEIPIACERALKVQQLCVMLLQILIDRNGSYRYSKKAGSEIEKMWRQMRFRQEKEVENLLDINRQRYLKKEYYSEKMGKYWNNNENDRIYCYSQLEIQKQPNVLRQTKQLLQIFTGSLYIKKDVPHNPEENLAKSRYQFNLTRCRIMVRIRYLSYLLSQIWFLPLSKLSRPVFTKQIQKIKHLEAQIFVSRSNLMSHQKYSDGMDDLKQLQLLVKKVRELLILIQQVPVCNVNNSFQQLLRNHGALETAMFEAIHRQFKYYIINIWHSMFPSYVSKDFIKLIYLYGELEQIPTKADIICLVKSKIAIKELPDYFVQYLKNSRGFEEFQIKQLFDQKFLQKKKEESSIPSNIQVLADKYSASNKIGNMAESDAEQVFSTLSGDKNNEIKCTILTKKIISCFCQNYLPPHRKLAMIYKCIQMQSEIYQYYTNFAEKKTKKKMVFFQEKVQQAISHNQQTIELLKYHTITEIDKLKNLVWVTADYWLMTTFCVIFEDLGPFRSLVIDICESHDQGENKNFLNYIQKYVLNWALKSKHGQSVLKQICQGIDIFIQSLPPTAKLLKNWLSFSYRSSIGDDFLWAPQMLVRIGYKPVTIVKAYFQQLQSLFNRLIPIQSQTLYCLKFLSIFSIIKKYDLSQKHKFVEAVDLQITSLQRQGCITEKTKVGMRKMLDQIMKGDQ